MAKKYDIEPAAENVKYYGGPVVDLPTVEKIEDLRVGKIVKIVFLSPGCPPERMWVKIVGFKGGRIVGVLDNVPACAPLKLGEVVTFGEQDIVDIYGADATTKALLFLVGAAALGFMGWALYRSISPAAVPAAAPPPP